MPDGADGVVRSLLRGGLLDTEEVLAGRVQAVASARRHDNARVYRAGRDGYLVKLGRHEDGLGTLAHEARVLELLHAAGAARPVVLGPRVVGYDREQDILVLGLLVGARNLREVYQRDGLPGPGLAARLAAAARSVHILVSPGDLPGWGLPVGAPPVLSLPAPPVGLVHALSGGNLRLLAAVQGLPRLCAHLERLRRRWRATALVHGDLRWDNCLLTRGGDLILVDWEFARAGDPLWDVGCALADYLAVWLRSIPATPGVDPVAGWQRATVPLGGVRAATGAFWAAYAAGAGPGERPDPVAAARFTAARLLDYACEDLDRSNEVTPPGRLLAQLAANMLDDPGPAASQLLGLGAGVSAA